MVHPSSLVLVCLLPTPRDMEIVRVLGWYRIPFRSAPKVVAVDYLAFYQPASYGIRIGQIEWVASVRGHELTTRSELLHEELDHPRAREEYYKIQLAPLERLSQPIMADKWKRLTFLYTTGEYLFNARKLEDLVIHSDERQLLWQSLRERALNYVSSNNPLPELDLAPDILAGLLGIKESPLVYDWE